MSKAFHALDLNTSVSTGEILDVLKGIGGLTEGRTSTIYQPDWENIWRSWGSGERAWRGGRRVKNQILQSEDFSTTWSLANTVIATNVTTAPSGELTADKITDANVGGTPTINVRQNQTVLANGDICFSVYADKDQTDVFRIYTSNFIGLSTSHSYFDLTNGVTLTVAAAHTAGMEDARLTLPNAPEGWWRCWIIVSILDDGAGTVGCGPTDTDNDPTPTSDGTNSNFIWGAQLENVSGQADQTPSEYIPTTTAAIHKIFGTNRSGIPLADMPWLYGGPAGTNEITYSRDLTNAAWTESGSGVAAFDAVGLEGVANTASTLTDNSAGSFEFLTENVAVPNDSDVHVLRVFILKDNDETRFPRINFELTDGTTQQLHIHLNTKTGATDVQTTTGTVDHEVNDTGDWWEILISVTNNATGNITAAIVIYPAAATVIDTAVASATGSIIVGNAELHLDKSIAQVRGSTPIFTSGSTVTVNASDLSFDDANHVDLEGAYYCEFKNVGANTVHHGGLLGVGTDGRFLYGKTSGASISSVEGSTVLSGPAITLAADDTEYKIGLAYGGSLYRINTDDVWGTAAAYDGAWDNTENKIRVLAAVGTNAAPITVMLLRNLRRYDLTYADAQDAIDGMMNGIFPSEGTLSRRLTVMDVLQHKAR